MINVIFPVPVKTALLASIERTDLIVVVPVAGPELPVPKILMNVPSMKTCATMESVETRSDRMNATAGTSKTRSINYLQTCKTVFLTNL